MKKDVELENEILHEMQDLNDNIESDEEQSWHR